MLGGFVLSSVQGDVWEIQGREWEMAGGKG